MACKLRQDGDLRSDCVELKAPCNVIPHWWYKEITTNSGAPDGTAISVLSEVVYQNRFFKDNRKIFDREGWWSTSYSHFEHKLNYPHSSIKGALKKLVKCGILETRSDPVRLSCGTYVKRLAIKLSDDFLTRCDFTTGKCDAIPHYLYHQITNRYGSPDFAAIVLLSEAIYWHRPATGKSGEKVSKFRGTRWQTSYAYLEQKFGYSHARIRRAFVTLEKSNKVRRVFSDATSYGQVYSNRLFVELSDELLASSGSEHFVEGGLQNGSIKCKEKNKKENLSNRSMIYKFEDFGNLEKSDYSDVIEKKLEAESFSEVSAIGEEEGQHLREKSGRHMSTAGMNRIVDEMREKAPNLIFPHRKLFLNYMLKAISSELRSDEYLNSLVEKSRGEDEKNREVEVSSIVTRTLFKDMSSISESECEGLRQSSGRWFSHNAMNEIMEAMSRRHCDKAFVSRAAFLSYMSEVLRHEKRREVRVNHDTFRIRGNMSEEEVDAMEREKFLATIEYSLDMSPSTTFKKKLVGALPAVLAHRLLSSYVYSFVRDGVISIVVSDDVDLGSSDLGVVLDCARSVYDMGEDGERLFLDGVRVIKKERGVIVEIDSFCDDDMDVEHVDIGQVRFKKS